MWLAVAFVLVAVIAYAVSAQAEIDSPGFEEGEVPVAELGTPVTVIFGTVVVKSSNCVWFGDTKYKAVKS